MEYESRRQNRLGSSSGSGTAEKSGKKGKVRGRTGLRGRYGMRRGKRHLGKE